MPSKNHTEYQREYRKQRVHRVIIFSQDDYKTLLKSAQEYQKPFSSHVRELALSQVSNQYVLPNDKDTKRVQILLIKFGTTQNQIAHVCNATFNVSQEAIERIQTLFKQMEQDVMAVYRNPPLVENVVRKAILKNPDYLHRIKTVLNEFL